jgi:hypothetical protein
LPQAALGWGFSHIMMTSSEFAPSIKLAQERLLALANSGCLYSL